MGLRSKSIKRSRQKTGQRVGLLFPGFVMKKLICIVGILALFGCKSVPPSEAISNSVVNGLKTHTEAIYLLERQTTPECKTDAFIANLNALKTQTENIVGQVKSIGESCKVEKDLLQSQIDIRNLIIGILSAIIGLILFIFIRKRG